MRVINCEQGTEEWLAARLGVPSASSFGKLITPTGKKSSTFDSYVNQLVAERITGEATPFPQTDAMARGSELEPHARDFYEFMTDNEVKEVGFIKHAVMEAGCSPDGLIDEMGGLEIKCPLAHTHVETLRSGKMPTKHVPQVQGCMWITRREWWDFVSYHPSMESLIVRVERDDEYIEKMAELIAEACEIIDTNVRRFKK